MVKAKLNDIVCIQTTHSFTEVNNLRTKTYKTFVLAKAVKVNRKGVVEQYVVEPNAYPETTNKLQIVMVIGDPVRQASAKDLFNTLKGKTFSDAESVKSMIVEYSSAMA